MVRWYGCGGGSAVVIQKDADEESGRDDGAGK